MDEVAFFEGRRPLTNVVITFNKGKTRIAITPWDEWQIIKPCPFTLSCGNSRSKKVTNRFGIERTQTTSFENTIGASIGVKGVAALEGTLKTKLGEEVKFQAGTEEEETFTFDSPKCGYKVVRLYQHTRSYHIGYEDVRFWHRCANEVVLTHWFEPIYDATYAVEYDARCNCKNVPEQVEREGTQARITCGPVSKLAVQWKDTGDLEFADKPGAINRYFENREGMVEGGLSADLLPDYLRFLAHIESGAVVKAEAWLDNARFSTAPVFRSAPEVIVEFDDAFEPLHLVPSVATVARHSA